jgi:chromosome segregation ATPase
MSKKNGAVFSKRLFGYKKSDVNEYIRNSDQAHSEEIAALNFEKSFLADKLKSAEAKIAELEALRESEKAAYESKTKKLIADYENRLGEMTSIQSDYAEKLNESESRASSYLKMADTSSVRAESAEAELTIMSAALEDSKNQIEALNKKLALKEAESERLSEIESLAKKAIADSKNESTLKRPFWAGFFNRSRSKR